MRIQHTPRFRRMVNLLALATALIGLTTLLVVFGTLMYRRYFGGLSCEEWLSQEVKGNAFRCVAESVVEEGDHAWLMIQHDHPYRIRLCDCEPDCDIRDIVATGDSVIKRAGELSLEFVDAQGTRRRFAYPCCD